MKTEERKGDWINTWTGRKYFPLDPRVEEVALEDVAHALCMQCRFTGHCAFHYSPGQHALIVARVVAALGGTVDEQLWALHHDDAEAYLIDVPRPVKRDPRFAAYRAAEYLNMRVIREAFDLSHGFSTKDGEHAPDIVLRVDEVMPYLEKEQLMNAHPDWRRVEVPQNVRDVVGQIPRISPEMAKVAFLKEHFRLDELRRTT